MPKFQPQLKAVLAALKFQGAEPERLRSLDDAAWKEFLPLCDMMHLTIPLRQACNDDLPPWVRSRIDQNIVDNAERFARIKQVYLEIAAVFRDIGVEHLVLKGFAQSPDFVQDPSLRMQSDLDLFCPPESIFPARDALSRLGYEPIHGLEHQPTDHLPAMMRKPGGQWRGNHFDPELPLGVDLHFRFWNSATSRMNVKDVDQFWIRRIERHDTFTFPALSSVDSLGYAALHVFHHLQQGGLTPYHVYELAGFLHRNSDNGSFWETWETLHDHSLRRIEAIAFRLATEWFACRLPEKVEKEICLLPASIQMWFRKYADSPLNSLIHPNKDALWLHLSLTESSRDKMLVFCSGLFPVRMPPAKAMQRWSWRAYPRFLTYAGSRVIYHLCSIPQMIWSGLQWWHSKDSGKQS